MFVYGRNSIEEALIEKIPLRRVIIARGKEDKFDNLIRQLKEAGVQTVFQPEKELDILSRSQKHQGIIGEIELPANVIENEDAVIDWASMKAVIALDGITDTGNLGALIRSALLFDFDAVVLPRDNSARITPQTIKASAGAVYRQKIIYINSLNAFVEEIKAEGFFVYGLAGEAKDSIKRLDFAEKICYIIGSERKGIRKSVKKSCDNLIRIPTTRKINSLNASVSGAIAMWEYYRKFS